MIAIGQMAVTRFNNKITSRYYTFLNDIHKKADGKHIKRFKTICSNVFVFKNNIIFCVEVDRGDFEVSLVMFIIIILILLIVLFSIVAAVGGNKI